MDLASYAPGVIIDVVSETPGLLKRLRTPLERLLRKQRSAKPHSGSGSLLLRKRRSARPYGRGSGVGR